MDYSHQELVLGKGNQKLLAKKAAAIVGIGAIGTTTAELLARSGIGKLILIDRDLVEHSNLQHQRLYNHSNVGELKAIAAKRALEKLDTNTKIIALPIDLNHKNLSCLESDIVLDCTDNMETRFLIDYYCCNNNIPWIYASAIRSMGYVLCSVKNYPFSSIFRNARSSETCETAGVLNSITSLVSSIQSSEALKILLGKPHEKDMVYINLSNNTFKKMKVTHRHDKRKMEEIYRKISSQSGIIKYCSSGLYQFSGNFSERTKGREFIKQKNMMLFKDRVLITAKSLTEAKALFSKHVGN